MSLYQHTLSGEIRELESIPEHKRHLWAAYTPPEPGPLDVEAEIVAEAQRRLDAFAFARGYDDIKSLVTYVDDPDPVFAQEGAIGKEKRSAMWAALRDYKNRVIAGEAPLPQTIDDIPGLPDLTW